MLVPNGRDQVNYSCTCSVHVLMLPDTHSGPLSCFKAQENLSISLYIPF